MCKYCNEESDNWTFLIDKDTIINGKRFGGLQVCIEPLAGKKGKYINAGIDSNDGISIIEGNVKIKYCPMCGEKLV